MRKAPPTAGPRPSPPRGGEGSSIVKMYIFALARGYSPCPLCRLRAVIFERVRNISNQIYCPCVRMSAKDYELLKEKSAAAGLSANACLMAQLETNRPVLWW